MIESPEGVAIVHEIAAVPGVDVVFAASGDSGSFAGYRQENPRCQALITKIHDATLKAKKKLGSPVDWREREGLASSTGPTNRPSCRPARGLFRGMAVGGVPNRSRNASVGRSTARVSKVLWIPFGSN